ncbi:Cof-like hydrolase [Mycolicibacterium canariasense]|uniref:Cof-like hydrolase n=1 Tax=Mycolicibacterium canariasense TaxID=228230 RepID=A0A117IAN7_MYCCR|nr:Cof-like hydrolase [Mycolicibacterium canariasense]
MALEPDFAGGVAEQVLAFLVGEDRAEVQGGGSVDVDVHDDGGVLAVWAGCGVGVPAGLDQAHERIGPGRKSVSAVGGALGDHPDLIQRQPAFA